jgi:O-antigen chain-terminating methyltransferase
LAFENVFRGSREDVKRRQSVYIPALKKARGDKPLGPALDLGCGRGEWLELMRENQVPALGVDSNRSMVSLCRSLGLDVRESDVVAHLRSVKDSTLGVVTSFHMVEHLSFEMLIAIIDECVRVLEPGGLLLVETPNPHNILVGSCTFYMDPTHRTLLPATMLRFFMEARGLVASEIFELNPYPVSAQIDDHENPAAKELNRRLFGPQDYGIIARRV